MDWAVDKRALVVRFGLVVGAVMTLANLALGPDSILQRAVITSLNVVVVPFCYFGMRAVLGLQVKIHGLSPFVRQGCNLFFYFFAVGSLLSVVITVVTLGTVSPMAVGYWAPASLSLGALDVYAMGIRQARSQSLAT